MKKYFILLILCLVFFGLIGCIPKRVVWSPDGQRAVVIAENGLHLCNAEGALTPLLITNATGAVWFPKGEKLAVARTLKLKNWADVAANMDVSRREQMMRWGNEMVSQLKASRSWDEIGNELKHRENLIDNELNAVRLYVRDQAGEVLREKAGEASEGMKDVEIQISVLAIGLLKGNVIELGPTLASEAAYIWEIRIAPDGGAIVYSSWVDNDQKTSKLFVVGIDGERPAQLVEKEAACYPDWSTDSKSLVYIQAIGAARQGDELRLGTLVRRSVRGQNQQVEVSSESEGLAGILFYEMSKVRCLGDGRIIFSSMEVQLPSTRLEMPQRQQLFIIDPARQPSVIPVIPRGVHHQLPELLSFFEISPDEKRIAILDAKGRVFVYTFANGSIDAVQSVEGDGRTIAVWRNSAELTLAMPNISSGDDQTPKHEIVIWNAGKIRVLSQNWPEAVRKDFIN